MDRPAEPAGGRVVGTSSLRHVRRCTYLFFRLSDDLLPDVARLVSGEVALVRQPRLLAISPASGTECVVSPGELELLTTLPADTWSAVDALAIGGEPIAERELRRLGEAGVIVLDTDEEPLATLARVDARLARTGWDPYAALYHAVGKWRDVDAGDLPTAAAAHADRELPPPAFHSSPAASEPLDLPLRRVDGALFETLRGRRTTRGFDPDAAIGQDELGLVLYYTFGCHGRVDLGGGLEILKKTSPSGGGLHPIEAYPLVVDVDGVAPGLHHYRADRHALELLLPLEPSAAADLLVDLCAGQRYLATARALVVMTARFGRSFWKYRSTRAYAVVLMDAAHLSQTLYLVAGQLGLGAFVSAAVNGANIEELLGIDGVEEGAIAVCGLGRPSAQRSPYDLVFEPYVPRAR